MASTEFTTNTNHPYKNTNINELNKCTLCGYKSHIKSTFQRHLMKSHGIKLKNLEEGTSGYYANLGRIQNDYAISTEEKFAAKEVFTISCRRCDKKFKSAKQLSYHRKNCQKLMKAIEKDLPLFKCPQCDQPFLKKKYLNRHAAICGKQKSIHCSLCPFKCLEMHRLIRHFIDKHNLICVPVDEPDFEQALNNAPYVLERAVAVETLPDVNKPETLPEEIELRGVKLGARSNKKRIKPDWICEVCNKEFTKQRHLNKHRKYDHP